MNNNNRDRFEVSKKNPFLFAENNNENFFLAKSPDNTFSRKGFISNVRRLNDYDSTLLEEDAYKDVNDDAFKLEYKMSKIEEDLKEIESQILIAKDISDFGLVDELVLRKNVLQKNYNRLLSMYNEKSISARISEGITSVFGIKIKTGFVFIKKWFCKYSEIVLSILPGNLSAFLELKKSLNKLENINKSVDDLMTINIPYGENYNKYEQLSKYIIKANSIHGSISKTIKNK